MIGELTLLSLHRSRKERGSVRPGYSFCFILNTEQESVVTSGLYSGRPVYWVVMGWLNLKAYTPTVYQSDQTHKIFDLSNAGFRFVYCTSATIRNDLGKTRLTIFRQSGLHTMSSCWHPLYMARAKKEVSMAQHSLLLLSCAILAWVGGIVLTQSQRPCQRLHRSP